VSSRYFFGLQPPVGVARLMARCWQDQADDAADAQHLDDLHMTLVFLGESPLSPREIGAIVGTPRLPSFTLQLDQLAYWPKPRVSLLQPSQIPDPLLSLVGMLRGRLSEGAMVFDVRSYKPHVTLARRAAARDSRHLSAPIEWRVDGFCLYVSDWRTPGPHYSVVNRWRLD
jgi:2'-5' RNA ligase